MADLAPILTSKGKGIIARPGPVVPAKGCIIGGTVCPVASQTHDNTLIGPNLVIGADALRGIRWGEK